MQNFAKKHGWFFEKHAKFLPNFCKISIFLSKFFLSFFGFASLVSCRSMFKLFLTQIEVCKTSKNFRLGCTGAGTQVFCTIDLWIRENVGNHGWCDYVAFLHHSWCGFVVEGEAVQETGRQRGSHVHSASSRVSLWATSTHACHLLHLLHLRIHPLLPSHLQRQEFVILDENIEKNHSFFVLL